MQTSPRICIVCSEARYICSRSCRSSVLQMNTEYPRWASASCTFSTMREKNSLTMSGTMMPTSGSELVRSPLAMALGT